MDAATGGLTKLEGYTPGDGASVTAIVPCEDGSLWVLERSAGMVDFDELVDMGGGVFVNAGDFSGPSSQVWRKLDAAGEQELDRIDITELAQKLGVEAVTDTRMDREGRLYAASGAVVTALDRSLSTLFTCKGQDMVEKLISLSDGSVGAVTGDGQGRTVYAVSPDSQTLGRPVR